MKVQHIEKFYLFSPKTGLFTEVQIMGLNGQISQNNGKQIILVVLQ
jgi:hypothetical protein